MTLNCVGLQKVLEKSIPFLLSVSHRLMGNTFATLCENDLLVTLMVQWNPKKGRQEGTGEAW